MIIVKNDWNEVKEESKNIGSCYRVEVKKQGVNFVDMTDSLDRVLDIMEKESINNKNTMIVEVIGYEKHVELINFFADCSLMTEVLTKQIARRFRIFERDFIEKRIKNKYINNRAIYTIEKDKIYNI